MKLSRWVVLLLLFVSAGQAQALNFSDRDYILKYYVQINSQDKGLILIDVKGGNSFNSSYFGVTGEDRLPFYAKMKKGEAADLFSLTSLTHEGKPFSIFYDLDSAPPEAARYVGGNTDNKAMVWSDERRRPKLTFDNIPLVTMESLLLGFFEGRIEEKQHYYLYEGGRNSGIRLYFEKEPKSANSLSGLDCVDKTYLCKRTNVPGKPDRPLFRVFVNRHDVPVKVLSSSERWSLNLGAVAGQAMEVRFDIRDKLTQAAEKDFNKLLASPAGGAARLRLASFASGGSSKQSSSWKFRVEAKGIAPVKADQLVANYMGSRFFGTRRGASKAVKKRIRSGSGGYYIFVDGGEVEDAMKEIYPKAKIGEHGRTFTRKEQKRINVYNLRNIAEAEFGCLPGSLAVDVDMMSSDDLVCKVPAKKQEPGKEPETEEVELDAEKVVAAYMATQEDFVNAELRDVLIEEGPSGDFIATVDLTSLKRVAEKDRKKAAARYLSKLFDSYSGAGATKALVPLQEGFQLVVRDGDLAGYRKSLVSDVCGKLARKIKGRVVDVSAVSGSCGIVGEYKQTVADVTDSLERQIYNDYRDLKIKGERIVKQGDAWSFNYVSGFEGVKHDCN